MRNGRTPELGLRSRLRWSRRGGVGLAGQWRGRGRRSHDAADGRLRRRSVGSRVALDLGERTARDRLAGALPQHLLLLGERGRGWRRGLSGDNRAACDGGRRRGGGLHSGTENRGAFGRHCGNVANFGASHYAGIDAYRRLRNRTTDGHGVLWHYSHCARDVAIHVIHVGYVDIVDDRPVHDDCIGDVHALDVGRAIVIRRHPDLAGA